MDIALKEWGKAPLLDLTENWHGDINLYVLNNVLMTLQPLARLLDPHMGHQRSPMEKYSPVGLGVGLSCPNEGQGDQQ
jgi:hypothetical protein